MISWGTKVPDEREQGNCEREEEDILIWDKWEEGDGRNDCSFYQRPLKKVLEELLSDRRLEGHQHSGFDSSLRQNMI